jgi:hypothetical protein
MPATVEPRRSCFVGWLPHSSLWAASFEESYAADDLTQQVLVTTLKSRAGRLRDEKPRFRAEDVS